MASELFGAVPLMICTMGVLVMLIGEVCLPARWPRRLLAGFYLALTAAAAVIWAPQGGVHQTVLAGTLFIDTFAMFFQALIALAALAALCFDISRDEIEAPGEYYALLLAATAGAMLFVSAAELIVLFIGLETMSMAVYALAGARLFDRRSAEAALKYFLLGSFSSVILLYGIALLYGFTGETGFVALAGMLQGGQQAVLRLALGFTLIGLLFKLALVPFHFWTPDVYEGAPTPVTAFMACVVKAAAVGAALRILWVVFGDLGRVWTVVIYGAALLTMVLGNLAALRQRSVKRMLAYSSIAHAGYIAMAFLAPDTRAGGGAAVLFYLPVYTFMTIGAFAVLHLVAPTHGAGRDDIERFNGLAARNPLLAGVMALFMLSLAGIPPGLGGLLGKFYVFNAAVRGGFVGLALVGIICAVVSCAYYLRVVVAMYFAEEAAEAQAVRLPLALGALLLLCAAAVVLVGVFPSVLYEPLAGLMLKF